MAVVATRKVIETWNKDPHVPPNRKLFFFFFFLQHGMLPPSRHHHPDRALAGPLQCNTKQTWVSCLSAAWRHQEPLELGLLCLLHKGCRRFLCCPRCAAVGWYNFPIYFGKRRRAHIQPNAHRSRLQHQTTLGRGLTQTTSVYDCSHTSRTVHTHTHTHHVLCAKFSIITCALGFSSDKQLSFWPRRTPNTELLSDLISWLSISEGAIFFIDLNRTEATFKKSLWLILINLLARKKKSTCIAEKLEESILLKISQYFLIIFSKMIWKVNRVVDWQVRHFWLIG